MYLFSIYQIARFQRLTDLSFCFVVGFKFEKFMNSRTSLKGMVWSKIQKYFIYLKMFFVKKQLQQSIFEHRKLFITALKDWSFCLLFTAVFWTCSAYVTPAPSYDENIKEKKILFCLFWDSSCSKSKVYLLFKNVWFRVFIRKLLYLLMEMEVMVMKQAPKEKKFVNKMLKRLQIWWNALLHICLSQRKMMFLAVYLVGV